MPRTPIKYNPKIGPRLKELIVSKGITNKALAEKIPCNPQHISNIINGTRNLTWDIAAKIIEVGFPEIRIEYLLGRDDYKTEEEADAQKQKIWEESHKATLAWERVSDIFLFGVDDFNGNGFGSVGDDPLIGSYMSVTNKDGETIGVVPLESYTVLKRTVEDFVSYQIHSLITKEMIQIPMHKAKKSKEDEDKNG